MESDLLKIILQIDKLIGAAKGLPSNPTPNGVNPAPAGSTFDTDQLPPILSTNEKSRVKEVAKIFKEIFNPGPEAARIKVTPTKEETISQNLELTFNKDQIEKGGKGTLGAIAGLLGGIGGIGSATSIAASSLPILAGMLGVAVMTLAGGKAFQWIVEGLKAAKDVDWKGIKDFSGVITGVLKDIAFIVKDLLVHFIKLGVEVAASWFDLWRTSISFFVKTFSDFGDVVKKYRGVSWDDLKKAGASIAGFITALTLMGTPPVALFEMLGNVVFTWANLNASAFTKNLVQLSLGLDRLLITVDKYQDADLLGFAKALVSSFTLIGGLASISFTAPLAMLGAFTAKVAALGLDTVASTFHNMSSGLESLGKAQHTFAEGMRQLQGLDVKQLTLLSVGIASLGESLIGFGAGTAFSSFFKSDELKNVIMLADKHTNLHSAATAVNNISNAFKTWSDLPLHNLGHNLDRIQDSVDKLDIKKLEKALKASVSFNLQDNYTKTTYTYLVTGKDPHDTGNGLLSITRDILEENRKLNTTAIKIKDVIMRIETDLTNSKQSDNPTKNTYNPTERRRTTYNNPRDAITPFGL